LLMLTINRVSGTAETGYGLLPIRLAVFWAIIDAGKAAKKVIKRRGEKALSSCFI
jgi:hypothetical protein